MSNIESKGPQMGMYIPNDVLSKIYSDGRKYLAQNKHVFNTEEAEKVGLIAYVDAATTEYHRAHSSHPIGQLRWVKASERLPEKGGQYFIRSYEEKAIGNFHEYEKTPSMYHSKTSFYLFPHSFEWLEELPLQPIKEPVVEREKKYSRSELFQIVGHWSHDMLSSARVKSMSILDWSDLFNDWFDRNYPSAPSIQQKTIQEGETLGQILKELRVAKHMSVENVLEATGVPNEYLRKLEADELRRPAASVLWKLAKYYSIDLKPLAVKAGIIIKAPAIPDQPSNEGRDIKISEDLKEWMDNHAECDSDEDVTLWINGATAMYRKLANDNDFFDSQIADYSRTLSEELCALREEKETGDKFNGSLIDQLKRELKSAHEERKEYRKELALSVLKWAIDMHVSRAGKYWGKDYSNIAYDDDGIVREYLQSLTHKQE